MSIVVHTPLDRLCMLARKLDAGASVVVTDGCVSIDTRTRTLAIGRSVKACADSALARLEETP